MSMSFSEQCERDIRQAQYVRVAVYPGVKARIQLEVSDCLEQLGFTSPVHSAGHYRVVDANPVEVVEAVNALRGKRQHQARLEVITCAIC